VVSGTSEEWLDILVQSQHMPDFPTGFLDFRAGQMGLSLHYQPRWSLVDGQADSGLSPQMLNAQEAIPLRLDVKRWV
jgi:hypothetical protein